MRKRYQGISRCDKRYFISTRYGEELETTSGSGCPGGGLDLAKRVSLSASQGNICLCDVVDPTYISGIWYPVHNVYSN